MGSIENISELCRLCLVKDQVNVPIFEENATKEQTFVKINSCLPVKVSRDDSLPKKICDGCSCKLDMLYTFRNTSVDSEKQLLKWLNQAGLSCSQSAVKDPLASTKPEVTIKQETFEPTDSRDDLGLDTHSYIMQQQKLPYSQEFEFGEPSESNVGLMTDEPAPKKAKRAAALNKASVETDEDDLDAAMQITKAEDEDSDEIDQPEYVEAPSTSADDQPGPSGVNKTTVEAPSHQSTSKAGHLCQVCRKVFSSSAQLSRHKVRHRDKKYKCPLCPKMFILPWELKVHISSQHVEEKILSCNLCNYKTRNSTKFKHHTIIRHTRVSNFHCYKCSKSYRDKRDLNKHLKRHDPNYIFTKFPCPMCPHMFTKKFDLKRHVEDIHSGGEGTHVCDICGRKKKSANALQKHKIIHNEKNFVCQVCYKAFQRESTLITHLRVHTGEKPFKCSDCDRAFSQKGSLNVHKRCHTGERPHKCEVCLKKFYTKAALNRHKCKVLNQRAKVVAAKFFPLVSNFGKISYLIKCVCTIWLRMLKNIRFVRSLSALTAIVPTQVRRN
nr:PREDICTED: zinc finger protein 431 isoform X12 [Tribolium castaneum]|eukprot:XP_015834126.1 PREDICTED: zinc finger protein 431 isoform X12 [Tribolium castaneum]